MKVTLTLPDGTAHRAKPPCEDAKHADVPGIATCPACGGPSLRVHGVGLPARSHDTYAIPAVCSSCGARVGTIRAQMDTIFGLEEDEAVLCSRYRVY